MGLSIGFPFIPPFMIRLLTNFIHQRMPLIPPMRSAARPNQNTNHRRMKRNRLESQFLRRSARDLLITFLFLSPPLSSLLSFLHWTWWNRCNHRQFAGRLAAGLLPAADRVRACWRVRICVWMCNGGHTRKLLFICICAWMCVCVCLKRSIWGKMRTISVLDLVYRLRSGEGQREIFFIDCWLP